MRVYSIFFLFLFLVSTAVQATAYKLDIAHSSVNFKIKHLVIATVTGQFKKFGGTFDFNEKTGNISNMKITIHTASIDTNEADRDKHLRSPDFFNVQKFPKITFESTKVTVKKKKPTRIHGKLTMLGKTKPFTFNFDYKGMVTDPWGNKRMIFEATGKLIRSDFGLTWNKILDKGGLMIGNKVKIIVEGQALIAQKKS